MKRFGFTLAEVLITLGIIGVVAALTLPSLLSDTQAAQVGPKLSKAVAMFEQANQMLLQENNIDSLTEGPIDGVANIANYAQELSDHLKISRYSGAAFIIPNDGCGVNGNTVFQNNGLSWISKDGIVYSIRITNANPGAAAPHRQRIGNVFIDINGNTTPNQLGTDVFYFALYNDGSLRPFGGSNWDEGNNNACSWVDSCPNEDTPTIYSACAGAIFENNFKVLYKMR